MRSSLLIFLLSITQFLAAQDTMLIVPGHASYCRIDTAGKSVLPSGRTVAPVGTTFRIVRGAFGLDVSDDNKTALVLHNNGFLTRVDLQSGATLQTPATKDIVALARKQVRFNESAYLGVAIDASGKTAYLSGGNDGSVLVWDIVNMKKLDSISLNINIDGVQYTEAYASDLTINAVRNQLLVLDRANFRLVVFDLKTRKPIASVPAGRIPFGIQCSPDGRYALIANVGLYAYPLIPGVTPTNKDSMMMQFPYYGIPSREAEEGITLADGRQIPGLGSALSDEAMSVWMVDLKQYKVVSKWKTGHQIGSVMEGMEIVGGASPNSIAIGKRFAYVSNATNDLISVIELNKKRLVAEIPLTLDSRLDPYRGIMPFGLCLSADGNTLYVACLGLNAVAVVDTRTKKVRGYIPTGWGTTRVSLYDRDTKLAILSAKGYGAGPNGGQFFKETELGTYVGDIQLGTFQSVQVPDDATLARYTAQVKQHTFKAVAFKDDKTNPCPPAPGLRESPIRHIVYITKENRTFDEVLGQIKGANGDASLARFGTDVTIVAGADTLQHVDVMPNHRKIAEQWAFSDNFYCDSDASIHGHHWMVGTIPNEYVEANYPASSTFNAFSQAPGRRMPLTIGGIDPEDYNERGGLWENLARNNISFFSFAQTNEFAGSYEEWNDTIFGTAHAIPWPLPKVLYDRTCREYAGYNMNIPDQFRVIQFEREFNKRWRSGAEPFPRFVSMQLPNDHGTGPRPEDGYTSHHSYMADNDLALGRILEILSASPFWDSMLVIVTEDDPQGGVDHIDAHRSILMMAGPYVKNGYVSSRHANFGSILRTIYTLLGLPMVNQYDATATLLDDFFKPTPDAQGYLAKPHDPRVFQADKALKKYGYDFNWRAEEQGVEMDEEASQRVDFYVYGIQDHSTQAGYPPAQLVDHTSGKYTQKFAHGRFPEGTVLILTDEETQETIRSGLEERLPGGENAQWWHISTDGNAKRMDK
jgi:DNA-binding beta-propeller fold protein YncE